MFCLHKCGADCLVAVNWLIVELYCVTLHGGEVSAVQSSGVVKVFRQMHACFINNNPYVLLQISFKNEYDSCMHKRA